MESADAGARAKRVFSSEAYIRTRASRWRTLVLPGMGALAAMGLGAWLGPNDSVIVETAMPWVGFGLGVAIARLARTWKRQPIAVTAEGFRSGDLEIPLADVVVAERSERRSDTVVITTRRSTHIVRALDDEAAGAIIRGLDVDAIAPVGGTRTLPLERRWSTRLTLLGIAAVFAIVFGWGSQSAGLVVAGLLVATACLLVTWRQTRRSLRLGEDGIFVSSFFGDRLHRFADIAAVRSISAKRTDRGARGWSRIVVEHRDGSKTHIPVSRPFVNGTRYGRAKQLARLARRAHADFRDEQVEQSDMLEQGGRDLSQWLGALRQIAQRTDYRHGGPDGERLSDIAENPRSPPACRTAAAVVLRLQNAPRLRIDVEDIADPPLREALQLAAEAETDAELLASLEKVADVSRA